MIRHAPFPTTRLPLLLALLLLAGSSAAQDQPPAPHPAQPPAIDTIAGVPFAGMDLTWLNGQNRQRQFPLQLTDGHGETVLTGMVLLDGYYNYNFARPLDNTQTISASMGRTNEFSVALATAGVETSYHNIIGRLWLQTGSMLHVVQEADASVAHGRNTGTGNLKLIREAAAGYHFPVAYGLNVELGIFMSYIGLESYMMQENWSYQRSLPCDYTPFYFQGARVQFYPTRTFKTELWVLNGWQTYQAYGRRPGVGLSNYFRPTENVQLVANLYYGHDTRPGTDSLAPTTALRRVRFHHDNSAVVRYYHKPATQLRGITQAAVSLNTHYGFEQGGGGPPRREAYFTGVALSHRVWFAKNKLALTLRGSFIRNPSRYLSFTPAAVTPNAYTATDARRLTVREGTATFDLMPSEFVTFRLEFMHRWADVPYFAGPGGTTSPTGYADQALPVGWQPDLRPTENRAVVSVNFRL